MLTGNDVIHSYIYREEEGKKGRNNVVSCLINRFKEMEYFSVPTFGDPTISDHNSVGQ